MAREPIPFNRPLFLEKGLQYVREVFGSWHLSGDGTFTFRCQDALEQHLGCPRVTLTTSCTDALELCALLLDLKAGDEVIMPAFTFVSTANAFVLRGARPVFVDIRKDTFNFDERLLAAAVTPRTRAVVVVHYAGTACEMDAICSVASQHELALIEDNAHGLFGKYRGRPLGTFGELATLSFHETKNLSCGEGGALVINDARFVGRAEILREKGTDRAKFFRGEIDKYTWRDIGSSFLPSDILAAILWAQIESCQEIQARRQTIYSRYLMGLREWADASSVQMPIVPPACQPSYHMFSLLLPNAETRTRFIAFLRNRDISALFHYQPLHLTPMGVAFGGKTGQCPIAESIADRIVRLPFYFDLSDSQQEQVVNAVREFRL